MANTTFLDPSALDIDAQIASQIQFLQSKPIFKDYNWKGSNISVLLELLARNTFLNAFYVNQVGSEMFLDSATLKEAVVSHAKELNYVPRSRVSSQAVVNITVTPANAAISTLTIPKGFYFSSQGGGNTVLFSTNESYVLRNSGGQFYLPNVSIYEGALMTEYFVSDGSANPKFVIASANVDISSLSVVVQNSNTDVTQTIFSRALNLYGLQANSNVYFVEGYAANNYAVIFGNGVTGTQLKAGNIAIITYRNCSGEAGDGYSAFRSLSDTVVIGGISTAGNKVSLQTVSASVGGAERESLASVKFNAPRHFSSQDRAITTADFITLIKENFPSIQAISVFGGEQMTPKQYGKVIISTKPYGQSITPDSIKSDITAFLADKMSVTASPIMLDPDYFYIGVNSQVSFDPKLTTDTTSDIETDVRAAIDSFKTNNLYDFNADFRYSKFCSTLDNAHPSIISNDTSIQMIKKITPINGFAYSQTFVFANEFKHNKIAVKRQLGNTPTISTDYFVYNTGTANTNAQLIDDGLGNLILVDENENVLDSSMGSVDYLNGNITINGLTVAGYTGAINLYATLANKDLVIGQSQILDIDEQDVFINVVKAQF